MAILEPTPTDIAYAAWLAGEEFTRQENIALARDYYNGVQKTWLTNRQKEFLAMDDREFVVNYCRIVVTAVAERLTVIGFESPDAAFADNAWQWWVANTMDGVQQSVHEAAVRDGETFVIVDWPPGGDAPRFLPHPRYVDPLAGGDGFGCKAFYPDDDTTRPMEYATKRWTEKDENGKARSRMTVYYPDRVEKFYLVTSKSEAGWETFTEEDTAWPVPWKDRRGQPLGIPVVHFKNPSQRSELWSAIPVQDALNKTYLDLMATADTTAFRFMVALGFIPTTDGKPAESDGSNLLKLAPGQIIGTTRPKNEADLRAIDAADLRPLLDLLEELVFTIGRITDTPLSRFQMSRQIAAEGTLKQQEAPLLAKIRARQVYFGNAWEQTAKVGRRLANEYGSTSIDDEASIETTWADISPRNDEEFYNVLALKREKLSVPLEQIWAEAGYSQEQITEMMQSAEQQRQETMAQLAAQAVRAQQRQEQGEEEELGPA